MPVPHPLLQTLLTENNAEARHFRKEIRSYNNALTFTSCSYTPDTRITHQGGVQPFQIHGELFHLQGPLDIEIGQLPDYAQLYFMIQLLPIQHGFLELLFYGTHYWIA